MTVKDHKTGAKGARKEVTVDEEIARVEANVEELPIFSATKRSRREEVVEWRRRGRDPKTGKALEQELVIRPAAGLGLPGQVERDVYYLVISPWIEANGFGPGGQIGPISYQEAITRLGWQRSGQNYGKIREALKTLVSLNFEFRNCILDGESRQLEAYVYGHLFDKVSGIEEHDLADNQLKRGEFMILAADWFVKNHDAGYVKPLNLTVYKALNTPIAQSLYNYLDKRAYSARKKSYEKQVDADIFTLKDRFRLGVRETKHLLAQFRRAHKALMDQWPILQDARIEKISKGRYRCVYTFDVQMDLPFTPGTKAPKKPKKPAQTPLSELVKELSERGITESVARRLEGDYTAEEIHLQIDVHDAELKQQGTNITNPAGRLRKRIQERWAAPDWYETPEKRQQRSEKAAQQAREEAEDRDRIDNWWKYETPEEKATAHVEGYWMFAFQGKHGWGKEPSEEQRHEAYLEALKRFRNEAEEGRAAQAAK